MGTRQVRAGHINLIPEGIKRTRGSMRSARPALLALVCAVYTRKLLSARKPPRNREVGGESRGSGGGEESEKEKHLHVSRAI